MLEGRFPEVDAVIAAYPGFDAAIFAAALEQRWREWPAEDLGPVVLPTLDEAIDYLQRVRAAVAVVVKDGELRTLTVLRDPTTSFWLHGAIVALGERDPVDAAHDLEVLSRLTYQRLRRTVAESGRDHG